jgi:hypothetical protein
MREAAVARLDNKLESIIVDLSATSLEELATLDDDVIAATLGCVGGLSARLWNNDSMRTDLGPDE